MIEQLERVVHHPYFVAFDLAFHVIVIVHVVRHACRAIGRVHRMVNRLWRHRHWDSVIWRRL